MYSYKKLDEKLNTKGLCKTDLCSIGISSRTIAKISKGQKIATHVLKKIAEYLECDYTDLFTEISENHILQVLRDEKGAKISGGLYHELQVRMTYNSNHMEGSRLSEEQTRFIYETNTIDGEALLVDDIIETSNHFRAIDFCIDRADDDLNEDFIKELHRILKQSTKDSSLEWFNVGEYKSRANVVGGMDTTEPNMVAFEMSKLISEYLSKDEITIEDIIAFHCEFEHIHPFQDGNGRVGRLVAFKECLHHNIVPFIIEDTKKLYYYRGLANWQTERGWLIDTCLDGQDTFKRLLNKFGLNS